MLKYEAISTAISKALQLRVSPIAVCLSEEAPEGLPTPETPAAAGCVFWERGAESAFVTTPSDHSNCVIGMHTHHMPLTTDAQQDDLKACLQVFGDLGYVRPDEVGSIPVLSKESKYVTYAPLALAPQDPSAVLLLADSRQSLAITEAVQQVDPTAPPALGRPACAVIPQVVNTEKPALSLGCCGARAYLDVMTDDFALWALPGTRIAEYAERIQILASANQILTKFHALRRIDVDTGASPSIKDSLARLENES